MYYDCHVMLTLSKLYSIVDKFLAMQAGQCIILILVNVYHSVTPLIAGVAETLVNKEAYN